MPISGHVPFDQRAASDKIKLNHAPLLFEFVPDAAETVRASAIVQRRARFGWVRHTIWPMLFGLIALYRYTGVAWSEMWLLYLAIAFVLILRLGAPLIQRWQLRRLYAGSPILREPQQYEFTRDALAIRGGPAASTMRWDAFREAIETDEFFLFYFAPRFAYYLPKRVIADPRSANGLRALVHSVLGERARGVAPATAEE